MSTSINTTTYHDEPFKERRDGSSYSKLGEIDERIDVNIDHRKIDTEKLLRKGYEEYTYDESYFVPGKTMRFA